MRGTALALVGLLLLLPAPVGAKGLESSRAAVLDYLEDASAAGASPLAANVVEAAVANGLDPQTWPSPQHPATAQLTVPGPEAPFIQLLRPLRALALAQDPRAPDLAQRVRAGFDDTQSGSIALLNDDAYAILALRATGATSEDAQVRASAAFLRQHRNADGGWGWAVNGSSSTDMTGLVVLALDASGGQTVQEMELAARYVRSTKAGDGFAESAGGAANCESTVWGLRTLALTLQPMDRDAWRFLLGLQRADGAFAHVPGGPSDLLCSTEAASLLGDAHHGLVRFRPAEPTWIDRLAWTGIAVAVILLSTVAVFMSTRLRQP